MALQQMALYAVRFNLPDGEHIMAVHSVATRVQADADFVRGEVNKILSTNPDSELISIEMVEGPHVFKQMEDDLRAKNPDRPLAGDLNLDTANRLLTNPQIARDLAASQTPG